MPGANILGQCEVPLRLLQVALIEIDGRKPIIAWEKLLRFAGLLRYLQRASTVVFIIYRIGLGLLLLALVAVR